MTAAVIEALIAARERICKAIHDWPGAIQIELPISVWWHVAHDIDAKHAGRVDTITGRIELHTVSVIITRSPT